MPEQLPKDVADEPPAARLVYIAIEGNALDLQGLVDRTGLSKRRIRTVANRLEEIGMIASYHHPSDARRRIYFDPETFDAIEAHQQYTTHPPISEK